MTEILHIVKNVVSHDSRVLKETGAILERFPDKNLAIAGFHDQGYAEEVLIGYRLVHCCWLQTPKLPKGLMCRAIKFKKFDIG